MPAPRKVRQLDRAIEPGEIARRHPIHVICDNVRSAYNVGSFFRTCDAAAVAKLHLCGISASPPNDKLAKTALSTEDYVPWEYHSASLPLVARLRQEGIPVFSVEVTDRSEMLWEVAFPRPVALVFGHEIHGVSDDILKISERCVEIPTGGVKNSINVATAVGIVLYEVIRQFSEAS
jgi:tRNA G18 (ribose-2'-O)-methylase SpoU